MKMIPARPYVTFLRTLVLLIVLCATGISAKTQTVLAAGDIAVIGFKTSTGTQGGNDCVKLLTMVDLTCGTQFVVTDNNWNAAGSNWFCSDDEFAVQITVTGKVCAGSVMYIDVEGSGNSVTSSSGSISRTDLSAGPLDWGNNYGLNSGGDNVFVLQIDTPDPQSHASAPRFIFGIRHNGTFAAGGDCSTGGTPRNNTGLPSGVEGLVLGTSALQMSSSQNQWHYNCGGTVSGTQAALLSSICNNANWTSSGGQSWNNTSCVFTVTGPCAPPVPHQPSGFVASAVTFTSATVSWTNCPNTNVLVICQAGSPVSTDPTSGTAYTANPNYGSGSAIGSGFVVYIGQGSSVNLTGLTAGITYYIAIYEFSCSGNCYNIISPLTGNFSTPLAVELASFSVNCEDGKVVSEWATYKEVNNQYFELQGSHDASHYAVLDHIHGNGNSDVLRSYHSEIRNTNGFRYFRLSQVDDDGTRESFEATYLDCDDQQTGLTATYTDDQLWLTLPSDISDDLQLTITDISGKVISAQVLKSPTPATAISLPYTLSEGIYLICLLDERDGRLYFSKVFRN